MAEFLNTSKAYAEIEDIINKANSRLVLISPYIKIPEPLLERLKYADKKKVQIVVVCRKDDLKADEKNNLKQLKTLELRFDEHLHAKCFYNEESMVITSLNLYEHSQQHNREMGVLLTLKDDHNVFNEARDEAEFIVSRAEKDSLIRNISGRVVKEVKSRVDLAIKDEPVKPKSRSYSSKPRTKHKGYCIRCGKNIIPLDVKQPLCHDCWEKWNIHKNPSYKEKYCHTCGRPAPTSKAYPRCDYCYDKSRR